jgi:hypothetical protein
MVTPDLSARMLKSRLSATPDREAVKNGAVANKSAKRERVMEIGT